MGTVHDWSVDVSEQIACKGRVYIGVEGMRRWSRDEGDMRDFWRRKQVVASVKGSSVVMELMETCMEDVGDVLAVVPWACSWFRARGMGG